MPGYVRLGQAFQHSPAISLIWHFFIFCRREQPNTGGASNRTAVLGGLDIRVSICGPGFLVGYIVVMAAFVNLASRRVSGADDFATTLAGLTAVGVTVIVSRLTVALPPAHLVQVLGARA